MLVLALSTIFINWPYCRTCDKVESQSRQRDLDYGGQWPWEANRALHCLTKYNCPGPSVPRTAIPDRPLFLAWRHLNTRGLLAPGASPHRRLMIPEVLGHEVPKLKTKRAWLLCLRPSCQRLCTVPYASRSKSHPVRVSVVRLGERARKLSSV